MTITGKQYQKVYLFSEIIRHDVIALSDIDPGQEIQISYLNFLGDQKEQKKLLKLKYLFDCQCNLCINCK